MSTSPSDSFDDFFDQDHQPRGNGPWHQLRSRVEPLLGDLEQHLGRDWHIAVDQIFSQTDLTVAKKLMKWKKSDQRWFAVQRFHIDALPDQDHEVRAARTLADAVAFLVEDCQALHTLPSALSVNADRDTFEIWLGAQIMARACPMVMRPVGEVSRRRAEGTIVGLRKFDNIEDEFLKRVRRWPGLSRVEPEQPLPGSSMRSGVYPSAEHAHHPLPKEWLLSTKALCARCGHIDPSRQFLETVAAAAFDAPSWHHLSAHRGKSASVIAGPWCIASSEYLGVDEQIHGYYVDGIDAAADFFERAADEFITGWPQAHISFAGWGDLPVYRLSQPYSNDADASTLSGATTVRAGPLEVVTETNQARLQDVVRAMSGTDTSALESLFGIGRSKSERLNLLDTWAGERLIASDGPWRFTMSGDNDGAGSQLLWARRLDPDGSCVERAAVSAYKAQLRSWREHQVLCGDYDGTRPEAIIDGLSTSSLTKLQAVLPDQEQAIHRCGGWPAYNELKIDPRGDRFGRLVERFERRKRGPNR